MKENPNKFAVNIYNKTYGNKAFNNKAEQWLPQKKLHIKTCLQTNKQIKNTTSTTKENVMKYCVFVIST